MEPIDIIGMILLLFNILVPVAGFTYLIRRSRDEHMRK